MDIWIILDGEKSGPIHDFDIRKKIESGELPATTPAWHEGLGAWRPLSEISLFSSEFDRPLAEPEPSPVPRQDSAGGPLPPPLPEKTYLIRRFWARWLDLYFFAGIWWLIMWIAGRDIGDMLINPLELLFQYIPWFVIEALMLHRFATTPGKWLLGIRVVNNNGSFLSLPEAGRRCARVLFLGIGFGMQIVCTVCQLMAVVTTRRIGRPLWDHAGGHRITATPLQPVGVSVYVISLFIAMQLQWIVVAPYVMEEAGNTFPILKEQFEKNPPWHLPKR
ncbi:MAG: RDD family protein [Verrucomicrobiota bacterium]